eukprot:s1124_g2.t1
MDHHGQWEFPLVLPHPVQRTDKTHVKTRSAFTPTMTLEVAVSERLLGTPLPSSFISGKDGKSSAFEPPKWKTMFRQSCTMTQS